MKIYRIAKEIVSNKGIKILSQSNYIILGVTDDNGSESQKVPEGTTHGDLSWEKSIILLCRWVYFPKKGSIFSWDNLNDWQENNILEHLKDRYGIVCTNFDSTSRFSPITEDQDDRPYVDASSELFYKTSQWYKKEEGPIPTPFKITKVNQDKSEDIESLKGKYIIDTTPYGALKKFLAKYPFLYDYEEAGITLMAVIDEEHVEEVKEKYQRKIDEKQRIKDQETRERMKNTWYGND